MIAYKIANTEKEGRVQDKMQRCLNERSSVEIKRQDSLVFASSSVSFEAVRRVHTKLYISDVSNHAAEPKK